MVRRLFMLTFGAALILSDWAAARAFGAEEGGGGGADPLAFRFDLGLWTIVVFLILLWVLKRFAWGPILEGLQKREQSIRGALVEAQSAREEAHRIRTELQAQLDKAGERVAEIMEAARRDATRLHEEMTGKARAEIQAERDRLRREIELAKDQALHELWTQTAQLATLVSAKALGRHMTESDHRHLVDEALADLRQAGTNWLQQGAGVGL